MILTIASRRLPLSGGRARVSTGIRSRLKLVTMASNIKPNNTSSWKQYGGYNRRYTYQSPVLGNTTTVSAGGLGQWKPASGETQEIVYEWL